MVLVITLKAKFIFW